MINASKEFKEKLKNGAVVVNYADVTLSDGTVLHLEPKDFMIGGCSIEDKTTDGKFGVGFVVGKTLAIKIANHDERFSIYDFYNSIIRVYVAMQMDNGTIEKIRKGVYYATIPSTKGEIIEISAVDGMFLLDKDYSASRTTYPATLQTILTNACLDCGIPIGFRQFDNMSFAVKEKPESGTYRQIVSYACQIAGYNARIDNDGYMQLIWYNSALLEQYNYVGGDFKTYPHDTILDGGDFDDYSANTIISSGTFTDAMPEHVFRVKSLDVHTDDVQITGIKVVGEDDKTVLFGEEGYLIEVKNPFANGKEQEVANYLGGRMVGMMFRPFSAQILSNPLYEPFEVVRVSDWKGNAYVSIINSVLYTVGSYTQISCEAEDPVRNGSVYYSEAAAAVVEARRKFDKQLSTYDKAVQNMNQLAGNAMGFHTTYEEQSDGSRITYLHDKPVLEESKTIYKQTIDGFFISTDGGKTYTAGFDKNGNAVVNILYAIGIVADWIKGGTFTVGGLDNKNGIIEILGADGKRYGSINNLGAIFENENYYYAIRNGIITLRYLDNMLQRKIEMFCAPTANYFIIDYYNKKNDGSIGDLSEVETKIENNGDCRIRMSYHKSGSGYNIIDLYADNTGAGIKISIVKITENGVDIGSDTFGSSLQISSLIFKSGESNSILRYYGLFFNGKSILTKDYLTFEKVTIAGGSGQMILSSMVKVGGIGSMERGVHIYETGINANGGFIICGGLTASGGKSRLAKTRNYSDRLLYCYETTKPYFGDIGEAVLDGTGVCYILIDDIFYETINTDCQYQVFLQKYGQGDVWVEERNPNYFIAKGTPNLKFGWEIKARQLGFETERMENFVQEEPEEFIDYEKEAQNYIESFYKEALKI